MQIQGWSSRAIAAALWFTVCVFAVPCAGQETDLEKKCEYGVTLALSGDLDGAEKVFVSLLSESPGDPRAYVNLGNIHLLQGRFDTAVRFYDLALARDAGDAGIVLNRSTAYLAMGDHEQARQDAARGVEMAGDANAAADLLGLKLQTVDAREWKASDQAIVMKDEVRSLLALVATPPDSQSTSINTQASGPETGESEPKKRRRVWHTSGPRAAEQSEVASVLYWRHAQTRH